MNRPPDQEAALKKQRRPKSEKSGGVTGQEVPLITYGERIGNGRPQKGGQFDINFEGEIVGPFASIAETDAAAVRLMTGENGEPGEAEYLGLRYRIILGRRKGLNR